MTVDRTNPYPGIEYGPEVDAALERVFEAQEALRDTHPQRLHEFFTEGGLFRCCDASFNREAYVDSIKDRRQALQQANERLSELCARACEKAGCYD